MVETDESPAARLRRMISELKEFMGMTQEQIAEETNWTASTLSVFMNAGQEDVRYTTGRKIELLYEKHAAKIKEEKLERARKLIASAGGELH